MNNGCKMLHGIRVGEEAGARYLAFFRVNACCRRWKVPPVRQLRVRLFQCVKSVPPWCSATCGCKSQCNGCMKVRVVLRKALQWLHDVAWDLCWGGSRSTKPCAFSCKVAAVGDEGQLVCEAVAGALVATRYRFLLCDLQRVVAHVCVVLYALVQSLVADRSAMASWLLSCSVAMWVDPCVVATCCCQTGCNGYMNVARDSCWGGSRSTIPCVFPCKWLLPPVRQLRVRLLRHVIGSSMVLCVLQRVVVHVCVVLCACWIPGCSVMAACLLSCSVAMCIQLEHCIRMHWIRIWGAWIQDQQHIFSYTKHIIL